MSRSEIGSRINHVFRVREQARSHIKCAFPSHTKSAVPCHAKSALYSEVTGFGARAGQCSRALSPGKSSRRGRQGALIPASICHEYSVGLSIRPICTRWCFTMTHMIRVCSNFRCDAKSNQCWRELSPGKSSRRGRQGALSHTLSLHPSR